jgi:hypothetical protein
MRIRIWTSIMEITVFSEQPAETLQHSAAEQQPKARPPTQRKGGSRGLLEVSGME